MPLRPTFCFIPCRSGPRPRAHGHSPQGSTPHRRQSTRPRPTLLRRRPPPEPAAAKRRCAVTCCPHRAPSQPLSHPARLALAVLHAFNISWLDPQAGGSVTPSNNNNNSNQAKTKSSDDDDPKARGDRAMESGRAREAADAYTQALAQRPGDPVLLSNRSAARAAAGDVQGALADAVGASEARPGWAKAHSRRGYALFALGRFGESVGAYEEALRLDPESRDSALALQAARAKAGAAESAPPPPVSSREQARAGAGDAAAARGSDTGSGLTALAMRAGTEEPGVRSPSPSEQGQTPGGGGGDSSGSVLCVLPPPAPAAARNARLAAAAIAAAMEDAVRHAEEAEVRDSSSSLLALPPAGDFSSRCLDDFLTATRVSDAD